MTYGFKSHLPHQAGQSRDGIGSFLFRAMPPCRGGVRHRARRSPSFHRVFRVAELTPLPPRDTVNHPYNTIASFRDGLLVQIMHTSYPFGPEE